MQKNIILLTFIIIGYLAQSQTVSTIAGSTQGFNNGVGVEAKFNEPIGVAVDINGNIYVADRSNHIIRKITMSGVVTTFAGSTQGYADGTAFNAKFSSPFGIAVDENGNVYVADRGNHKIRKITPTGNVSTFAGSTEGFVDGIGTFAQFSYPSGISIDEAGIIYVADTNNHKIRKITPTGEVTTIAGSSVGYEDGSGVIAKFNNPFGLATDSAGYIYVADGLNNKIRKITPQGVVSTLAGSTEGYTNGTGNLAKFDYPINITVDASNNVYVADYYNHRIRKITPEGDVTTLAGSFLGYADGVGESAKFSYPAGVTIDTSGDLFIADFSNHKIRKITLATLSIEGFNYFEDLSIWVEQNKIVTNLKDTSLFIYTITGQQIKNNNLKSGIYILKLENKKGEKLIKKIVF